MAEEKNKPTLAQGPALVPEYLTSLYHRRYFDMTYSELLDGSFTADVMTFFQMKRLTKFVTDEIFEGQRVLQLGIASGDFEREVAMKMSSNGVYHIEDISPIRLITCKNKVAPWLNVTFEETDVCQSNQKRYDVIICFFLLHEIPDVRKAEVIRRALAAVLPEGRVIFIDYHRPKRFHPFRYFIKLVNRLFEPFAESLWRTEIKSYAKDPDNFIWDKRTFFGEMYQGVIAQKKY